MVKERRSQPVEEPMGIVISRGSRDEAVPRFSAFVYQAPAPDEEPPVRREVLGLSAA